MRSSRTILLLSIVLLPAGALAGEPLAVWVHDRQPEHPAESPGFGAASPTGPATLSPADFGLVPGQSLHAVLRTTLGNIDCTLNTDAAPASVKVFVDLARGVRPWVDPRSGAPVSRPLYDGTLFHRVIPGFLIQGGDPTGTGTGGPGFSIPDEIASDNQFNRPGLLAFANRGPNTNGSQFFVTDGPAHHLDGRYTRLGLCGNLDVIAAIARLPRGEKNRPVVPAVLKTVEIAAR